MTDFKITTAGEYDIYSVALLHKQLFHDHFLGGFSVSILEKFYLSFLHENIVFLVCKDIKLEKIAGFVVGGYSKDLSRAKNDFVVRNKLRIIFEILLKPNMWIDSLKRFFNKSSSNDNNKKEVSFRLLSIGVNENFQGTGIAKELTLKFEQILIQEDVNQYGLSVHADNIKAIKFYEKSGMTVEKRTTDTIYFKKNII